MDRATHKILSDINASIRFYSIKDPKEITTRINQLEQEWSIEHWLQISVSTIALMGVLSGFIVNIYWLILPMIVLIFLLQYAIQGWCPPVSLLRYFQVKNQKEINAEIYALKFLRNDFEKKTENQTRADLAISAVMK